MPVLRCSRGLSEKGQRSLARDVEVEGVRLCPLRTRRENDLRDLVPERRANESPCTSQIHLLRL